MSESDSIEQRIAEIDPPGVSLGYLARRNNSCELCRSGNTQIRHSYYGYRHIIVEGDSWDESEHVACMAPTIAEYCTELESALRKAEQERDVLLKYQHGIGLLILRAQAALGDPIRGCDDADTLAQIFQATISEKQNDETEIAQLKQERDALSQPPDVESWKTLVAYAYQMGGDGARHIQAITSEYVRMQEDRDGFQEAMNESQKDVAVFANALDEVKQERDEARRDSESRGEALQQLRVNACQLTDFLYAAVRDCGNDMIRVIDAAMSAHKAEEQLK